MDGWMGLGLDWMVIIGDRCSKSTFGDNKELPIWMWKKMHQTALDLYLERSSSALPDPPGWFHRRLHKYPPSWRWKVFSYLYIARSCPLKLPCGLVAYVRCWCIYAELAIELGIRIFSYVFKWTESECPSLIKTLQIIVRDAPWHQFCSFFLHCSKTNSRYFLTNLCTSWCTFSGLNNVVVYWNRHSKVLYIFHKLC